MIFFLILNFRVTEFFIIGLTNVKVSLLKDLFIFSFLMIHFMVYEFQDCLLNLGFRIVFEGFLFGFTNLRASLFGRRIDWPS